MCSHGESQTDIHLFRQFKLSGIILSLSLTHTISLIALVYYKPDQSHVIFHCVDERQDIFAVLADLPAAGGAGRKGQRSGQRRAAPADTRGTGGASVRRAVPHRPGIPSRSQEPRRQDCFQVRWVEVFSGDLEEGVRKYRRIGCTYMVQIECREDV